MPSPWAYILARAALCRRVVRGRWLVCFARSILFCLSPVNSRPGFRELLLLLLLSVFALPAHKPGSEPSGIVGERG